MGARYGNSGEYTENFSSLRRSGDKSSSIWRMVLNLNADAAERRTTRSSSKSAYRVPLW